MPGDTANLRDDVRTFVQLQWSPRFMPGDT